MGTSYKAIDLIRYSGDHPHAYGDKSVVRTNGGYMQGSSPRVWGQVIGRNCYSDRIRIIPTRMGTSFKLSQTATADRDHPHAYGDK